MNQWVMQIFGSPNPATARRKLSLRGQLISTAGGIVFFLAFLAVSPWELVQRWCPASSFHTRILGLDWLFVASVGLFLLCFSLLGVLLLSRLDLSILTDAPAPPAPRWRYFTPAIFVLACGSALSADMYIRSISYYCLTPDEIVVQTGNVRSPRTYTWNEVREIHGWCWTNNGKGGPFLGGSVDLILEGGPNLSVNLLDNRGAVRMVKSALKRKNYQYYVNSTVTPDACPHDLYPLLWSWADGKD